MMLTQGVSRPTPANFIGECRARVARKIRVVRPRSLAGLFPEGVAPQPGPDNCPRSRNKFLAEVGIEATAVKRSTKSC